MIAFLKRQADGFTLIEALLSIAIIVILVGVSMPIYYSFQTRNDLDITTQNVASMLRRAQSYARSNNQDSAWSVKMQSTGSTLFKGTDFAGRNTVYDETVNISSNITVGGLSEIGFASLTGVPNTNGTITLSSNSDVRTITINAKGTVDY